MRLKTINVIVPECLWKRVKYAIADGKIKSIREAVVEGLKVFLERIEEKPKLL